MELSKSLCKKISNAVVCIKFHPDNECLVCADNKGVISIWDRTYNCKKNEFMNHYFDTKTNTSVVTDLLFINKHTDDILLAVATNDGSIRIWDSTFCDAPPRLITAWKVDSTVDCDAGTSSMLIEWNQSDLLLYAASYNKYVHVWDIKKEQYRYRLSVGNDEKVTSLSYKNNLLAVGCDNGVVYFFDSCSKSPTQTLTAHDSEIMNVTYSGHDFILTANCKGSVKIWDAKRNLQPYNEIRSSNKGNIIAAVSHSHRFVIACASEDSVVNVYNFNGNMVATIRPTDGFLIKNTSKISCIAYHPLYADLAIGTEDGHISVHTGGLHA